ncbi:MAG: acyltransferase [Verrucomicrobia bacterium]|nr:acyltransferase [Verrucomicrobiota bacterium]
MHIVEKLYRSPCGQVMSLLARLLCQFHKPLMLYGYTDPATKSFQKYVRMSSTVTIVQAGKLSIGDHVWIWHHSILDATGGLEIGEGCQIGAWVGLFTHGSNNSIRLLGRRFVDIPNAERQGYIRSPIKIGAYTFISSGAVVLPGVTIGKGCVIGPHCLVMSDVPDHAVIVTPPGRVAGNTLQTDARLLDKVDFTATYYDLQLIPQLRQMMNEVRAAEKK